MREPERHAQRCVAYRRNSTRTFCLPAGYLLESLGQFDEAESFYRRAFSEEYDADAIVRASAMVRLTNYLLRAQRSTEAC